MFLEETLHTRQRFLKLVISSTISTPYIAHTHLPKGTARNDGYLFLEEKLLSELLIGHTCIADIREGIEGTFGVAGGEADAVETIDKHTATTVVVIMHGTHIILTVTQCFQRGFLGSRTGTHDRI